MELTCKERSQLFYETRELVFPTNSIVSKCSCSVFQEDMETSKYVCRMWLARHKFYKINNSSL